jgi:hypothetical protein
MICKTKTHSINSTNNVDNSPNLKRGVFGNVVSYLTPEKGTKFGDTFVGSGIDYYLTRTGQMTPGVIYQPSKTQVNFTYILLGLAGAGTIVYLATRPKNKKRK